MTSPGILFGVILSTIYGFIFHLFIGGGLGKLGVYIIFSWIGFWIGQLAATQLGISFITIGSLHIGVASIFSWISIGIGHWLSRIDRDRK